MNSTRASTSVSKTAYILGAGFSWNAGIPLQSEFLKALVRHNKKDTASGMLLAEGIKHFIKKFFGTRPDLEDIFTCIDMSANSGHNLSKDFPPSRLRSIRRILIARILQTLNSHYKHKKILNDFIKNINLDNSSFVNLNWDTVVEREILRQYSDVIFDYGCGEIEFDSYNLPTRNQPAIRIAKVHGSTNWLYCDNCRKVYSIGPTLEPQVAAQILKNRDLQALYNTGLLHQHTTKEAVQPRVRRKKLRCAECKTILGTRIATFSYRKVLDAPILLKSWFWAEQLLTEADKWIFIGYSLPPADYEFKYLLKRIELSGSMHKKKITVIGKGAAESYKNFFKNIKPEMIFEKGLANYVKNLKVNNLNK